MPTQTTVSGPFRTMRAVSGVHSPRGSSVEQTRIRVFIISESTRARSRRGGRYGPAGLASSEKGVVRLRGLEPPRGLQHRHWRPLADTEEIGRANVCTTVTNANLVCRLLLEKKKKTQT